MMFYPKRDDLCIGTLMVSSKDLQELTDRTREATVRGRARLHRRATEAPDAYLVGDKEGGGTGMTKSVVASVWAYFSDQGNRSNLQRKATEMLDGALKPSEEGRQKLRRRATEPADVHMVQPGDAQTKSVVADAYAYVADEDNRSHLRRRATEMLDGLKPSQEGRQKLRRRATEPADVYMVQPDADMPKSFLAGLYAYLANESNRTKLRRRATQVLDGMQLPDAQEGRQKLRKRATEPAEVLLVQTGDGQTHSWLGNQVQCWWSPTTQKAPENK